MVQSPKSPAVIVNPVYVADDSIELVDTKSKDVSDINGKHVNNNGFAKRPEDGMDPRGELSTGNGGYDVSQSEKLIIPENRSPWLSKKRMLIIGTIILVGVAAGLATLFAVRGSHEPTVAGPSAEAVQEDPAQTLSSPASRAYTTLESYTVVASTTSNSILQGLSSATLVRRVQMRLSGGAAPNQGWIEVLFNGTWTSVYDDGTWNNQSARVVCRQLNYGYGAPASNAVMRPAQLNCSQLPWSVVMKCSENGQSLVACVQNATWSHVPCNNAGRLEVSCNLSAYSGVVPQLRLVGSSETNRGRLEVLYNGIWGLVCSAAFGNKDATVACRQLGLGSGSLYSSYPSQLWHGVSTPPVNVSQPIWMSNISCIGNESSLHECTHNGWNMTANCQHNHDVAIECQASAASTASVTTTSSHLSTSSMVQPGVTTTSTSSMQRTVSSASTVSPSSTTTSPNSPLPIPAGVRLSGGMQGAAGGNVEIILTDGSIAFVHHGLSSRSFTSVLCRQLMYNMTQPSVLAYSPPPATNASTWLVGINCTGSESNISHCSNFQWGCSRGMRCQPNNILAIRCTAPIATTINPTPATTVTPAADLQPVRLTGGLLSGSRVLEILYNGTWRTLCMSNWSNQSADVVCRQLYGVSASNAHSQLARPLNYSSLSWSATIKCSGNEQTLKDCMQNGTWSHTTCNNAGHVEVSCNLSTSVGAVPRLRLVGSSQTNKGRLEVLYNGIWGLVCSAAFGNEDATVACRQLGLGSGSLYSSYVSRLWHGISTPPVNVSQPIWMSNISCIGNESNLHECPHNGWNMTASCQHDDDVAIECQASVASTVSITTTSSQISTSSVVPPGVVPTRTSNAPGTTSPGIIPQLRLVGGSVPNRGRLEVLYQGIWGLVCSTGFGNEDATVACRQLGLGSGSLYSSYTSRRWYGIYTPPVNTSQPIWMSSISCIGNESSLHECTHNGWNMTAGCQHDDDVAIECQVPTRVSTMTTSRPTTPSAPRTTTADVVPRLRLVGSSEPNKGRLEVLYNGIWGLVCSSAFGNEDATVACRQLGLGSGSLYSSYTSRRWYGIYTPPVNTSQPIWMSNVSCIGNESNLHECVHNGWNVTLNCQHHDDVAIECLIPVSTTVPTTTRTTSTVSATAASTSRTLWASSEMPVTGTVPQWSLQLSGGDKGALLIHYGGSWGKVCFEDHTIDFELIANVACRQQNFSSGYEIMASPTPHESEYSSFVLKNLKCHGNESSFSECQYEAVDDPACADDYDLRIQCQRSVQERTRALRLVRGITNSTGIVQLLYNGTWSTVCGQGWSPSDAKVVCRQLGHQWTSPSTTALVPGLLLSTITIDSFIVGSFVCDGNEPDILRCSHSPWQQHQCQTPSTALDAAQVNCH